MQLLPTTSLPRPRFVLLALLSLIGSGLFGQISLSPYSRYGLGTLYSPTSARNYTMGGIGVGTFDATSINRLNPASYADLALTTLDISGFGAFSIQTSNTNEARLNTAGLHNLNLGFSNKNGFGLVFGLAPYSSAGYEVITRDSILTDTAYAPYTTTYEADGGLNQFYIGTGIRFLKNFRAGANLTFAFGNTSYQWTNDFDEPAYATVNIEERTSLRGIIPQFGLQYGDTLRLRSSADRTKVLRGQDKGYVKDLADLDKELASLEKENENLTAWETKTNAEIKEIETEKATIQADIERMMENEEANKKAISRAQEKTFRMEKKRKKLVREIKSRTRDLRDARASIKNRRSRLEGRRATIATEIEEIKEGKRSATIERSRNFILRGGATIEPASSLNGDQLFRYNNTTIQDTSFLIEGAARIPMKMAFGFSVVRPNRWTLGLDVSLQDWSQFEYFNDVNNLNSAMDVRLGGEWIPKILGDHYRSRIAYRAGIHYSQTGLTVGGNAVPEYGATAGVGLPIGRFNRISGGFSRINIGAGVSKRGNLNSNPLEEMNFHLRVGVNLGEIWFLRRRID